MWCPACRADVAAELSLDSRHFQCARCRTELGTALGSLGSARLSSPPTDAERNARELLAKWNAQNLLDTSIGQRPIAEPAPASPPIADVPREQSRPLVSPAALPPGSPPREVRSPAIRRKKRRTDPMALNRRLQEESIRTAVRETSARQPTWGSTLGQMCAYGGIGLITCGTAVVVWGYFGGPASYAPTGWLVTTLGQMFLFLGVVTLISSGMEQTSGEVTARIEQLGQRLMRIESLQQSRFAGPHTRRKPRPESDSDNLVDASI